MYLSNEDDLEIPFKKVKTSIKVQHTMKLQSAALENVIHKTSSQFYWILKTLTLNRAWETFCVGVPGFGV